MGTCVWPADFIMGLTLVVQHEAAALNIECNVPQWHGVGTLSIQS